MVIFSNDGLEQVINGGKTVGRMPLIREDEYEFGDGKILRIFRNGVLYFEIEEKYDIIAVPSIEDVALIVDELALHEIEKRFQKVGQIRVLSLEVDQNPGWMIMGEARREGFAHPDQFKKAWVAMYGEAALWKPAYRIEFEYLPAIPEVGAS
jgi:hypothetical protein